MSVDEPLICVLGDDEEIAGSAVIPDAGPAAGSSTNTNTSSGSHSVRSHSTSEPVTLPEVAFSSDSIASSVGSITAVESYQGQGQGGGDARDIARPKAVGSSSSVCAGSPSRSPQRQWSNRENTPLLSRLDSEQSDFNNSFADDPDYSSTIRQAESAINSKIFPERIYQGSSGSYFVRSTDGVRHCSKFCKKNDILYIHCMMKHYEIKLNMLL